MDKSEFIKNQISELTDFLKKLLSLVVELKDAGNADEAIDKINLGLLEILNQNIEEIINSPIEHFMSDLLIQEKLNHLNLDLLAELFLESGHLLEKQHDKEKSKRLFSRSLAIYQYLLKSESDFSYERHLRMKELREILLQ